MKGRKNINVSVIQLESIEMIKERRNLCATSDQMIFHRLPEFTLTRTTLDIDNIKENPRKSKQHHVMIHIYIEKIN